MRRMSHHVSHYSLSLFKKKSRRERNEKFNYFKYFEASNRKLDGNHTFGVRLCV